MADQSRLHAQANTSARTSPRTLANADTPPTHNEIGAALLSASDRISHVLDALKGLDSLLTLLDAQGEKALSDIRSGDLAQLLLPLHDKAAEQAQEALALIERARGARS